MSQCRIDVTVCPQEVQKPSLFEQHRDNWVLPRTLDSTHIALQEVSRKLAATSFGKCQCLKIGNCANNESQV